jgi:hypothetical protein
VGGGLRRDGTWCDSIEVLFTAVKQWADLPPRLALHLTDGLPGIDTRIGSGTVYDGQLYIFGMNTSYPGEAYNPRLRQWRYLSNRGLPEKAHGMYGTAVTIDGQGIMISPMSGHESAPPDRAMMYFVTKNEWDYVRYQAPFGGSVARLGWLLPSVLVFQ